MQKCQIFSIFAFRCFVSFLQFHSWIPSTLHGNLFFSSTSLQLFQAILLSLITTVPRMSHFLYVSFRLIQGKTKSGKFYSFKCLLIFYLFPWSKVAGLFRNHNLIKMSLRRWEVPRCLLHSFLKSIPEHMLMSFLPLPCKNSKT